MEESMLAAFGRVLRGVAERPGVAALLAVGWALTAEGSQAGAAGRIDARPPNVVVILVDDLGVGDCGFSGGTDVPTPAMDRFAREGTVCSNAYVTPSCSPTRAAILTGRYPGRFGVEDNRPLDGPTAGMDLREVLLPRLLRDHGYATALFGKWHLGRGPHGPHGRGFEHFCGWIGAAGKYIDPPLLHDDRSEPEPATGWVDDILADRAAGFVRDHADRPFFLHAAFMAAHLKQEAMPEDLAAFAHLPAGRRMAAAIISRLDRGIGRLLDSIREAGLEEMTLVFLLSDNGGEPPVLGTSNGPHRGQKFDVLEGGIRVPFAIRWPGVVPAGGTFEPMVHGMDVFATAAAATGASPPNELDGVDLVPFLRGEVDGVPHERLFWVYNDHADWRRTDQDTNLARRLLAVREEDWKLIVEGEGPPRLYDLSADPGEANDLANVDPARTARLALAIAEWDGAMVRQVIPPSHPLYGRNRRQ
jgi:arylsulfatase A-like enzyme